MKEGEEMIKVYKDFRFEAAHFLPNVPKGHKCRHMHGHSYFVRITVYGPVVLETGMLIDYSDISRVFEKEVFDVLDHRMLNDIGGLENSTSELLAMWIWHRMSEFPLHSVEVKETPTAGAIYGG